ncbi:hypothetical protein FWD20_04010, partial [Candidatus Saccharibacteria bacterium]|nr:hypothetical protein [Candidatus Saccharibacteria bacterium]
MDEEKRQQRFREVDESNTARRAGVLNVPYQDMRGQEETIPLAEGMMDIADMYKYRMVPLVEGDHDRPFLYGITLSTPESHVKDIKKSAAEDTQEAKFVLISDSAFRVMMRRYDPPKEVHYEDVEITGDDSTEERQTTIASMTEKLNEVRSSDMLDYLVFQADRLSASDIHLENQRSSVRIRFRIDGTLHE